LVLADGGQRPQTNEHLIDRAPDYDNGIRGRACCVHVFSGDRADIRGHRCGKVGAVTEVCHDGKARDFCTFHASPAVAARAARQAERDAAERARWDAKRARLRMADQAPKWQAALQQIADGDNDPRRTARIALGLETADDARS
jgi:hypothetical protein